MIKEAINEKKPKKHLAMKATGTTADYEWARSDRPWFGSLGNCVH